MNLNRLITCHDIALHWQVSPKSVRRWIHVLEKRGLIKPLRPTRNTLRLTVADYWTLESEVSKMQCQLPRTRRTVRFPPKNPVKTDGMGKSSKFAVR